MVYVEMVHMAGGNGHEHIAEVRWRNRVSGETGAASRATMVDFIDNKHGEARVADRQGDVAIGVVRATPPYIRTHADGRWSDNLLALPRY